jgi:hypothetical protein
VDREDVEALQYIMEDAEGKISRCLSVHVYLDDSTVMMWDVTDPSDYRLSTISRQDGRYKDLYHLTHNRVYKTMGIPND